MNIWFPIVDVNTGAKVFTLRLSQSLREAGIPSTVTLLPRRNEFLPYFTRVLAPKNTSLVHINSWLSPNLVSTPLPLITTIHSNVHDPRILPNKNLFRSLYHKHIIYNREKSNIKRSIHSTAVSNYVKDSYKSISNSISTIYNYVDTQKFFFSFKKQQSVFHLVFAANPKKLKGLDLLIPIMNKLGPEFCLTCTFQPQDLDIRKLKYNNIRFSGYLATSNLIKLYHNSDALLFPTFLEGFGLAALEALSCGRPVITSNCSALPEIITDRVNGFLCSPSDINSFVNAAVLLRKDKELWSNMCYNARQTAVSKFSESIIIPQYINLYKSIS